MLNRKIIAYKSTVSGKYYAYGGNQDLPNLGSVNYYANYDFFKNQRHPLPKDEYPYTLVYSDDMTLEELKQLL